MELNENQLDKIPAGINPNNVDHIERQKETIKGFSENTFRNDVIAKLKTGELSLDEVDSMINLLSEIKIASLSDNKEKTTGSFMSR